MVILQSQFDELLAFASDASLMPELLKAKAVYFGATGEVFEDDDSFEQRMAAFRDFYVFDWKIEDDAATPAERFWLRGQFACPDDAPLFEGFLQTWLSLWEVRKLGKESLRLRDLFTERDVEVFERRQLIGLSKGDILEARLLPMGEKRVLSDAVIFHPSVVRKAIWPKSNVAKNTNRILIGAPLSGRSRKCTSNSGVTGISLRNRFMIFPKSNLSIHESINRRFFITRAPNH